MCDCSSLPGILILQIRFLDGVYHPALFCQYVMHWSNKISPSILHLVLLKQNEPLHFSLCKVYLSVLVGVVMRHEQTKAETLPALFAILMMRIAWCRWHKQFFIGWFCPPFQRVPLDLLGLVKSDSAFTSSLGLCHLWVYLCQCSVTPVLQEGSVL